MRADIVLANAERYVADGKYPEAVIEYRNAAKIDGRDAKLYHQLGLAYLKQNTAAAAQPAFAAFSKAVELDPGLIDAQVRLGEFYARGRQFDALEKTARQILERDPTHLEGLLLLAGSAIGRNRFDDAERAITTAKQAHPTDPKPLYTEAGSGSTASRLVSSTPSS
jgi:cytochrome c-type biogenesis protein CcmH/NrfG